jgi:hypothetical protein
VLHFKRIFVVASINCPALLLLQRCFT